jgi:hypothetical protein
MPTSMARLRLAQASEIEDAEAHGAASRQGELDVSSAGRRT